MLVSIVGTRPNLIKLAPIARSAKKRKIPHKIIHTGQHYDYELSQVFFEQLELSAPDEYLNVGSGSNPYQIGETVKRVGAVLKEINKESVVMVYGDTNATVGSAIGARKSGFRVCHVESGVRTGDFRLPEELNRIISEACSNLLFAPTAHTFQNIKSTNRAEFVGDVMYDSLLWMNKKITTDILNSLNIQPRKYCLMTLHRGVNVDDSTQLGKILGILEESEETIIFPIHPRTRKSLGESKLPESISLIAPVGYLEFLSLLKHSKKVLTDSGGVQKEAYALGIPCITLLDTVIWPEIVETGWNISVGNSQSKIRDAINSFRPQGPRPLIFGDGNAAEKILETLNIKFHLKKKL